ncbi:MAG: hypothetical protein ACOYCD_10520 [Kiritimatiellia bacterium]|jgi:hypothetical protein
MRQLVFPSAICYALTMRSKRRFKPVRACHACMLNLGIFCWVYADPRRQWRWRQCPGFDNPEMYKALMEWQQEPHVKTRKQLRQDTGRQPGQPPIWRWHARRSTRRIQRM